MINTSKSACFQKWSLPVSSGISSHTM